MLVGAGRSSRPRSIVVACYPNHHSVIWYAGLRTPIDASEDALDRLVDAGYLIWDESPRPLRRLRVTPAGYLHARGSGYASPPGQD